MRTTLFRLVVASSVLTVMSAAPALAQSVVRGTVRDAAGQPVADATIVFDSGDSSNQITLESDDDGNFLQVGLSSGSYEVTASKEGVGTQTLNATVSQGQNQPLAFVLAAARTAEMSDEERKEALMIQALASTAQEHMNAGRYTEAVASLNDVLVKVPDCGDCYHNIGVAQTNLQNYDEAEAAFKQALVLDPESGESYTGLARIYNAQKRFDLAADANAKAAELAGPGGGGGGAEAAYNQGVVLFNSGNFAGAKEQFMAAAKADPNMAVAHYQLGMTALNLGQIPEAVAALETYLKVAPDGDRAAEVKAALPGLQQMLQNQ